MDSFVVLLIPLFFIFVVLEALSVIYIDDIFVVSNNNSQLSQLKDGSMATSLFLMLKVTPFPRVLFPSESVYGLMMFFEPASMLASKVISTSLALKHYHHLSSYSASSPVDSTSCCNSVRLLYYLNITCSNIAHSVNLIY